MTTPEEVRPAGWTVEQASIYAGLSVSTLNRLRVNGGGPIFLKVSARVIYLKKDLDAWLESHARRSTSDQGQAA